MKFRAVINGLRVIALGLPGLLMPHVDACAEALAVETRAAGAHSGFLGTAYERLEKRRLPSGAEGMQWVQPDFANPEKRRQYRAVVVDPVKFVPEITPDQSLSAETLEQARRGLTQALRYQVGLAMPLASESGPGVLRLATAITAVAARTQALKARELIPVALIFAAFKAATGGRDKEAVVAIEWELRDDAAGQVLAAGMREGVGAEISHAVEQIDYAALKPALDAWATDVGFGFTELMQAQDPKP